jgi:hypothetical protein
MTKKKLTKGEVAGIRLIADLFVINDLIKNVFAKHDCMKGSLSELKAAAINSAPGIGLAEEELQKQIKEVRAIWLQELSKNEEQSND